MDGGIAMQWLDRQEYPFAPQYIDTGAGKMHYIDEGSGPVVLMVHGTPTWSYLFRHFVRGLSSTNRCIAIDHLGFGLSEKPRGWSYTPQAHAANLAMLINDLDLDDITLIVHDYGGPIGLSCAIDVPERVRNVVVMNSWLWPFDNRTRRAGKFFASPVGRILYTHMNFSLRVMLRAAWGNRSKLTQSVYQHYAQPFAHPSDRQSTWILARAVDESTAWFEQLWRCREAIRHIPALIAWGMKDPFFRPNLLARWEECFASNRIVRLENTGHFVPEENWEFVLPIVRDFVNEGLTD
jgi:haloalkane dehalogenase